MDGGEMAVEVEEAVLAGGDALLKLLIGEGGEVFVEAAEDLVPGFEGGVAEEFFVGHDFSLRTLSWMSGERAGCEIILVLCGLPVELRL
jgi:hypothetical protein